MKNIKFLFLVMLGVMFMMTSCDEGALTLTVPLDEVTLDIDLEVDAKSMTSLRSDERVPFTGTYELDLSKPMFDGIREYINDNRSFTFAVNMVKILVTPLTTDMNFTLYNFKAEALVDGKQAFLPFSLPQIQIKQEVTNALLDAFANELFKVIQSGQPVTINVSGEVDRADVTSGKIGVMQFILDMAAKIDPVSAVD